MAKIIGNFVYFLRSGKTIDTVTIAKDTKPDHDPETNWTDNELPSCSSISPSTNSNSVKSRAPNSSGKYVTKDEIITEDETIWVATFEELNLLTYEMLFGTGELSAATQAQIMAGSSQVEGWVWLVQKDHNGNTIIDAEFWGKATIQGVNFEEDIVRPQIQFSMLEAGALGVVTPDNI
jgi:hypothetical protein